MQVTPKLPGLNPNATVFLSHKTSPQGDGQMTDTGQWDSQNDSGIGNSTNSGKYANSVWVSRKGQPYNKIDLYNNTKRLTC